MNRPHRPAATFRPYTGDYPSLDAMVAELAALEDDADDCTADTGEGCSCTYCTDVALFDFHATVPLRPERTVDVAERYL